MDRVVFNIMKQKKRFCKKRCLKKFCKIHRKTPAPESFLKKVSALRPATLLKKRLWNRCFPGNFVRFLRTTFFQNTAGRLLLIKLKVFCFVSFFVSIVFNWWETRRFFACKGNVFVYNKICIFLCITK